jgi:predicted transcriptional regulator
MDALWAGAPASGREVVERLRTRTGWAYTTVQTLLSRLVEKGAVRVRREGAGSLYEPAFDRSTARRRALRSLLDRAFDGAFGNLLHHLSVEERLSEADRERLRAMIAQARRRSSRHGRAPR